MANISKPGHRLNYGVSEPAKSPRHGKSKEEFFGPQEEDPTPALPEDPGTRVRWGGNSPQLPSAARPITGGVWNSASEPLNAAAEEGSARRICSWRMACALFVVAAVLALSRNSQIALRLASWKLDRSGDRDQATISSDTWRPGICSKNTTIPKLNPHRTWNLDPLWRRACEQQNAGRYPWQYPTKRNWCWIGLKAQCHADLKTHRPWAEIQKNAAKFGLSPSSVDAQYSPIEDPAICDKVSGSGGQRAWTPKDKLDAKDWFDSYVSLHVLGLKSSAGRWKVVHSRLDDLGIRANRVLGVDMRVRGMLDKAKVKGWIPSRYNFSRAQEVAYSRTHQMGPILGTLGCASAHFKAQAETLAQKFVTPLHVVLEDDSYVENDFVEHLWDLVARELPCDWDVLSLYSRCPFGTCVSRQLTKVQPDVNEPHWRCRQGVNWGMQGTLYRLDRLAAVQKIWKAAVFDPERPHCLDVDVALASISDQINYYAVPSVQSPGFLTEKDEGSERWTINQAATTTPRTP